MTDSKWTALAEAVTKQDTRSLARALRIVDDRVAGHDELLRALFPSMGRAYVVGITGNPGAGKSTLVDKLVDALRKQGKRVAVVAVDPTSPFSGGAILGDRIRMQRHFLDEGVFIRSLATRGALGGLSRSAADVISVFDAAGFDVVLVETVGVGQDELEVAKLAHTSVVICSPGMGDDIQAIKAGILEVADVFAVNKADREGADSTVRDLEAMMSLAAETSGATRHLSHGQFAAHLRKQREESENWRPPVVKTVASRNEGVQELLDACLKHREFMAKSGDGTQRAHARAQEALYVLLRDSLFERAQAELGEQLTQAVDRCATRTSEPYGEVSKLMRSLFGER